MEKEKPLSSKNLCLYGGKLLKNNYYLEEDVKQAVEREGLLLGEFFMDELAYEEFMKRRRKIFGEFE